MPTDALQDTKQSIVCSACGTGRESPTANSGKPRTPRGWKVIGEKIYCPKCKGSEYVIRAVSLPVAACDWDTIRPLLRKTWPAVRDCSNWLLTQYYASDTLASAVRAPKLPLWKVPYLYPAARTAFPDIDPSTLVAILNTVSAKYKALRFDMWRGAASLPVYRSSPLPLNAQAWKLAYDAEHNEWRFSFRFSGQWHELILRRDAKFFRQHASLRLVISGAAEAGEAALYESGKEVMLKIAGWFQRGQAKDAAGVVKARTAADAFLIATNGEQIWRLNADHVQRWIVGAQAQQQRLREDLKAERRFPKPMRAGIVEQQHFVSEQRRRRLDSWMHEAAAQLIGWTQRQHCAKLVWDDSYRSMFPSFPWFVFAQRIGDKCKMASIEFVQASEGVTLENGQALAETTSTGL
jgi:hypothetical protein